MKLDHPSNMTLESLKADLVTARKMYHYNELCFTLATVQALVDKIDELNEEAYTKKVVEYIFANKENIIKENVSVFQENSCTAGFIQCLLQIHQLEQTKLVMEIQELKQQINQL